MSATPDETQPGEPTREPESDAGAAAPQRAGPTLPSHHAALPDTLISLIVAFVIAMTFRGFVVEGFIIPTGSMAPTLLGDHIKWRSPTTGYEYAIDASRISASTESGETIPDAPFGPRIDAARVMNPELHARMRPGDRVLVMKWFYTLVDPNRYDVIVFRDPTNSRRNYIKRLGGLPNEEIWLADGDVFTRRAGDHDAAFAIRRKPDHVQRAVWQPVFDTAWLPEDPAIIAQLPVPWEADGWDIGSSRVFRTMRTDQPATLRWNNRLRTLNDWNVYNAFEFSSSLFNVGDLRVSMNVVPEARDLDIIVRIRTRVHDYEFVLRGADVVVRMKHASASDWERETLATARRALAPGRPTAIECWHVDQRLSLFVDGRRVAELEYDWDPYRRLELATGMSVDRAIHAARDSQPWIEFKPSEAEIELSFEGAATSVHNLRVDRDLYYQPARTGSDEPGLGTHPEYTAITGPDQFYMLGDNSTHSTDSRLWGEPDRLVRDQIDPTPNLVHRHLIIGKAWSVYFPSPLPVREGGARFVPDVGRVRFIR